MSLRGLRVQLLLWTILPLTLLLIGVAFTGIYSHQHSMRALVEDRDLELVRAAAGQLSERLESFHQVLRVLANTREIRDGDAAQRIASLAEASYLLTDSASAIAVFDANGQVEASIPVSADWSAWEVLYAPVVERALQRQMTAFSSVSHDVQPGEAAQHGAFVAVPIAGGRGVVGGVFRLRDTVEKVLSLQRVGKRGVIYLVSEDGVVLWHTEETRIGRLDSDHPGLIAALQDKKGVTHRRSPDGTEMVVAYAPVPQTGWVLVVEEPWNDVIAPIMRYSQVTPLILLLATVLSLLAVFFGVRNIIHPLQALREKAARVAWGDFGAVKEPVGGVQEIEDLRQTLAHMADQIRRYQTGMRDYIAAITRGQEEERKRLARELHDDTTQSLIALNQRLEMARKAWTRNPDRLPTLLDELQGMTGDILQGIRRYSRNLRPLYLEDLGFLPALEMRLRELGAQEAWETRLRVSGEPRRLPPDLEITAYRIVQEALSNIARHARASQVTLTVDFTSEGLMLTIEDNGIGFVVPEQPANLVSNGHFGLMGMRERALLYRGHLTIQSAPGQGTKLIVYLPH